jgi:hypothetical protein
MVILLPKSRDVMGRLLSGRQDQDLPRSIVVQSVPNKNSGIYFARVVSHVFVRTGNSFCRLSDVHRNSLRIKATSLKGLIESKRI